MAYGRPFRKVRLSQDSPVFAGPLIYHGGIVLSTAAADTVTIRDGNDASAEFVDRIATPNPNQAGVRVLESGVFIMRGVFADLSSANISDFVLFYDVDIPEALAGPRQGP